MGVWLVVCYPVGVTDSWASHPWFGQYLQSRWHIHRWCFSERKVSTVGLVAANVCSCVTDWTVLHTKGQQKSIPITHSRRLITSWTHSRSSSWSLTPDDACLVQSSTQTINHMHMQFREAFSVLCTCTQQVNRCINCYGNFPACSKWHKDSSRAVHMTKKAIALSWITCQTVSW